MAQPYTSETTLIQRRRRFRLARARAAQRDLALSSASIDHCPIAWAIAVITFGRLHDDIARSFARILTTFFAFVASSRMLARASIAH